MAIRSAVEYLCVLHDFAQRKTKAETMVEIMDVKPCDFKLAPHTMTAVALWSLTRVFTSDFIVGC